MRKLEDRKKAAVILKFAQLANHFISNPHIISWSNTHEMPLLEEGEYDVVNTMNFSEGKYTAICLSYGLMVMACNQLAWEADGVGDYKECKFWVKLQYQIRNKYLRRKEKDVGQFLSFID